MPRTVTADEVGIAYQVRGEGAAPLVLLAEQSNNHRWWVAVRDDFHGERSTITFDYRGTGESDKPDVPYSTGLFALDMIAVLDALSIGRADVYGTSMGGRVTQQLAARHPDRVRALVLGCTSPGGPHAVERTDEVRRSLVRTGPGAARRALLELMYTPGRPAANPGPYRTLGDPECPRMPSGATWRPATGTTHGRSPRTSAHPPSSCTARTTSSTPPPTPLSSRTVSPAPGCT
ncbi:alpha/beta fold hydrolase [Streptomyces globisporus]|uniref:Beta-ketoadipate enol-lactone hydrolase (EC) n=2 Tax=Streptomyces globisporus TaxID=1908 RepID=A0ABM9GZD2_STRGL|nr:alpha/beta hydrolase family protein [Streptomyces sp. HB202]CAH9416682.1 Beta-ketoadipate enol-lactone hydrolase (EC [Streptomyces globisporus]